MGIELRDVCKCYLRKALLQNHTTQAINHMTWSFAKNKVTCIMGPNGAGKTTLIKLMMGSMKPDHGTVTMDNQTIDHRVYHKFGYMGDFERIYSQHTPYELAYLQLSLVDPNTPSIKEVIEQALHDRGLYSHRHKMVKELSKGLTKKAMFLKATIHKPSYLILDEPFAGLDLGGIDDFITHLNYMLAECQTTIILSSHELDIINYLADEIIFLRDGSLKSSMTKNANKDTKERYLKIKSLYLGMAT